MPAFAKNPKFIVGTIIILWLAYVIYANFQMDQVKIHLFPWPLSVILEVRMSTVIIGSAIFGAAATLIVQYLWRRSSKNGSASAAA